jgi:hypothetical protein
MKPKKILALPTYLSGTTLGIIASILLLPGGFIMGIAFGLYWLADRMDSEEEDCYECDMTIEEFEQDLKLPVVTFESYPEAGFRFTRVHQCSNCVYDDACLTPDNGWCDGWEKAED